MKILFDTVEEKEAFLLRIGPRLNSCPDIIGLEALEAINCKNISCAGCWRKAFERVSEVKQKTLPNEFVGFIEQRFNTTT